MSLVSSKSNVNLEKIINLIENKPIHISKKPLEFNNYEEFEHLSSHPYLFNIYSLLQQNRLVTVNGPTGCGKTVGIVGSYFLEWEKFLEEKK